jgi:hypothetical protein
LFRTVEIMHEEIAIDMPVGQLLGLDYFVVFLGGPKIDDESVFPCRGGVVDSRFSA